MRTVLRRAALAFVFPACCAFLLPAARSQDHGVYTGYGSSYFRVPPSPYVQPGLLTQYYGGGLRGPGMYPSSYGQFYPPGHNQTQMRTGGPANAAPSDGKGGSKDLATVLAASGVANRDGRIIWPLGLRILGESGADALRQEIDASFAIAALQAAAGQANADLLKKIGADTKKLARLLLKDKEERFGMPLTVYEESERFLGKLAKAPRALEMMRLPAQPAGGSQQAGGGGAHDNAGAYQGGSGPRLGQAASFSSQQPGYGTGNQNQASYGSYGNSYGSYGNPYGSYNSDGQNERQPFVNVYLFDNYFQPDTVTATVGQTITWTNFGSHDHTVTSDTGAWDSVTLGPLAVFGRTFARAGTYPYHCTIHGDQMHGTITVRGPGG